VERSDRKENLVEAVGVELPPRIENTQVIDLARRSKLEKREKSGFEIRNRYVRLIVTSAVASSLPAKSKLS
jgi:hypothetical protein